MKYGNFNLQYGDYDGSTEQETAPRWGAIDNPDLEDISAETALLDNNSVAMLGVAEYVRELQEDLLTLGFSIVGEPSGIFDLKTEWAVRELQIYSKLSQVAQVIPAMQVQLVLSSTGAPVLLDNQEIHYGGSADLVTQAGQAVSAIPDLSLTSYYVSSLESVQNGLLYSGRISGVVNSETRGVIEFWLEHSYRCPVVIEAWRMQAGVRSTLMSSNIWRHDSMPNTAPRIFAFDFTGYYSEDAQYQVIGDYQTYMTWSGPRSIPPAHTMSVGELTSERLVGSELENLNNSQLSTFKVVRAVSEVECMGHFDSITAYDNAFISAGPCHWTLGIADAQGSVADGELGAFLSYFQSRSPDSYLEAFGFFGLHPESWESAGVINDSLTNYTARIHMEAEEANEAVPREEVEFNYYKTWHWFYRFVKAGRHNIEYQRSMWDMARFRIRDIRSCLWQQNSENVIGDIFTSERAVAILVRWHVRFPADVCRNGVASDRLRNALNAARNSYPNLRWDTPPSTWNNQHERALLDALADQVAARNNNGLTQTITQITMWPNYQGRQQRSYALGSDDVLPLSINRGSFSFAEV